MRFTYTNAKGNLAVAVVLRSGSPSLPVEVAGGVTGVNVDKAATATGPRPETV